MKKTIIICIILIFLVGSGLFLLPGTKSAGKNTTATPEQSISVSKSVAEMQLESMSLEEKTGQLFLACVSASSASKEDIASFSPGGYLFFADFFEAHGRQTAADSIAGFQEASSVPMLMAVDEEGGSVVRVSKFSAYRKTPFSSPQDLYQKGGLELLCTEEKEKTALLQSLGINVNLSPVCDLAAEKSSFIYPRTLGEDVETTARYVSQIVERMNTWQIGSALKHFPGYGQNTDTHTGIAHDRRPYETFETQDFIPFQAGIAAGAPCILVSHNIVECMDDENPASLSVEVHRILRETLNFQGVILTDDLSMDGVQGYSGSDNLAVAAIKAGNDLLCTSNYREQIPAVLSAVRTGELPEEQITRSALRILEWKEKLGLLTEL